METVFSLLAGLGLAAACGFRVFVPLFVASIAVHAGMMEPSGEFEWLGSNAALITFAVATGLEVGGYYVPWLDNALDTLATPAAVIAGSLVAASFATDMDPLMRWTVAIVAGGGLAATVQTASVAVRGFSFTASGGLANPLVSSAELGGAVATSALAIMAPVLAILGLVALAILAVTFVTRHFRRVRG